MVSPFDVDQWSVGNDPSEDCVYTSTVVQYKNLGAFQPSRVYLPIHAKCYSSFFENVAAPANQSSSKTVNFLFSLLLKWIETIISCSTILPNSQLESLAGFVGYWQEVFNGKCSWILPATRIWKDSRFQVLRTSSFVDQILLFVPSDTRADRDAKILTEILFTNSLFPRKRYLDPCMGHSPL